MPSWKGAYAFEFRGYVSEWSYSPRASAVGRPAKGVGRWAKDDTEMPAIGGQVPVIAGTGRLAEVRSSH